MDNDVGVIRHDPLAHRKSVHRHRPETVLLSQTILQLIDDRFEVRLRRARADDKKIGEARNPTKIEGDDIFRFLVAGNVGDRLGKLFGVNGSGPGRADV